MAQVKNDPLVDAILKQYEQDHAPKSTGSKSYDLKNYFSTFLKEGVKTGSKTIRILPAADGGTPFKEIFIHSKQVNGKWKKFACLKGNFDKDCPFCEARQALLSSGKDGQKELAKQFGSRKMYVLRVIDRDHEEDGVKFWRFNHDYTSQGIYDKIISIMRQNGNITDPEVGRDLVIDIARDHKNNCVVSGVVHCDKSPTLENKEQLKNLIEDSRTWEDVYSVKDYEYLDLVVKGFEPAWDKVNKQWVDKASLAEAEVESADNSEITMGDEEPEPVVKQTTKTTVKAKPVVADDDDDDDVSDLPF